MAKIITGLPVLISVTDEASAVGYKARPRLWVYYPSKQITVTVDDVIEVVKGPPTAITDKVWGDLVAYIELNRERLLQLWRGKISRAAFMNGQEAING